MKKWLLVAVILAVLGWAGWKLFGPGPEHIIRKRLSEAAALASFGTNERELAKLSNAKKLADYCTDDVQVIVDVPGGKARIEGHDELFKQLMAARTYLTTLGIELYDMEVKVAPDHQSAVVNLTIRASVNGERDAVVQELRFTLQKVGGSWLIRRIETLKTLS